jgi:hypothetical protein
MYRLQIRNRQALAGLWLRRAKAFRVNAAATGVLARLLQFSWRRPRMETPMENPTSYRVEVSGWDEKENFFVEKTTLDWTEGTGKKIDLRARVAAQAVVFVRLAQQLGGTGGFPIPYRAVEISARRDGYSTVHVEQLQPRMAFHETEAFVLTQQELA